jgi:hypothetical protein
MLSFGVNKPPFACVFGGVPNSIEKLAWVWPDAFVGHVLLESLDTLKPENLDASNPQRCQLAGLGSLSLSSH